MEKKVKQHGDREQKQGSRNKGRVYTIHIYETRVQKQGSRLYNTHLFAVIIQGADCRLDFLAVCPPERYLHRGS
jgi:hypothetical protein